MQDNGFDPWVRKIPWSRKWQPTPVFLLGKIPWAEEPGRLWSMGLQRIRHDWVTEYAYIYIGVPCSDWQFLNVTLHLSLLCNVGYISCVLQGIIGAYSLIFYWRVIVLQCCVVFYHTTARTSHKCTHILSLPSLPSNPPSYPSRSSQSIRLSSPC